MVCPQEAIGIPIKNRRYRKWAYQPKGKGTKWCEVCGDLDPHVLNLHHVSPTCHNHGREFDEIDTTITLCASCHAKCHGMYGGNHHHRPYVGPLNKPELIKVLRRERNRYRRISYAGEDLTRFLDKKDGRRRQKTLEECIKDAYEKNGFSIDKLSKLYKLSGAELRKILKIKLKIR